jgi:hypothetical protein
MPKEFVRTAKQALEQQRRDHEPGGLWSSARRAEALTGAFPSATERNCKVKKDDLWPSKYLKAADLPEPRVLKIKHARLETLKNRGGEETKLVVTFVGEDKTMPLNRTNFDSVCDVTGEYDSDDWKGSEVELYATTTQLKGEEVDCIRIRAPGAGAKKAAAKTKPAPKAAGWKEIGPDDPDDEIPAEFR